jgi:diguanylate cyclase (GGDEF)-like protein
VRRLLTSWVALTLTLVALCVGAGLTLTQLQSQVEDRSQRAAVETAEIVVALVVHRHVGEADFQRGSLTPAERAGMDADISYLLGQGRLVGLEVWRTDGLLIYGDHQHPAAETRLPPGELQRSKKGRAWVDVSSGTAERGVVTLDVFLPYEAGTDGASDGWVEVLLPQNVIAADVRHSTRQLDGAAALLVLVTIGALIYLRRRLLARERDASHDGLTGLLNRGALREQIRRAAPAHVADGRWAALLVVDLDGFKAVNDTLGHPAGDALLVQVARGLTAGVRAGDSVARLGGDEFAVVLTGLPNAATALSLASKLLDRLRTGSYMVHGVELSVDASIGVALLPLHGRDIDVLLQRADVAMYQAKRANSGVVVYDEENDPHDITQLGLLGELRRAIDTDELVLHYQPKARIDSGDLAGLEALVRWEHPTRGLLPPAVFIPIAENTGLMKPLTQWVLRTAIEQAGRWRDEGLMLPVAVNISPRSLLDGDLPADLLDLLAHTRLPADLLELEITETAIMSHPDRAIAVLRRLNAMGLRVAIDDFGAGYNSLAYLKHLPVQTLKIDRAFIAEILHSSKDDAITESIIGLGHKLGVTVLAEGIEDAETWNRLKVLGCDEGQGYYLARPMPAGQVSEWIAARLAAEPSDHGGGTPTATA